MIVLCINRCAEFFHFYIACVCYKDGKKGHFRRLAGKVKNIKQAASLPRGHDAVRVQEALPSVHHQKELLKIACPPAPPFLPILSLQINRYRYPLWL
jgi:hypothetical protein